MKTLCKDQPFSLVLSGGGALGIAHLGVLHDMETEGLVPAEVVGTSMGGIVCACIAIGKKEREIYALLDDFSAISKWIKFSFSGNAIVEDDKIAQILGTVFGERKMSDTIIPLKLITTNLRTGAKRVFDTNDEVLIRDAVLATMAIPGIFEEQLIEGTLYADGFLCENLGLNEACHDAILAVDVLGKNAFAGEMPDHFFKTSNVLEMFERSMRLLIYNQTKTNLKNSPKKILLLEPDTADFKTFHFHKLDEIRSRGLGLLQA